MAGKRMRAAARDTAKSRRRKRQEYMIYAITAIFLMSGLYFGLSRSQPAPEGEDTASDWRIIRYESAQLGGVPALIRVVAATDDYKLIPKQAWMLDRDDLEGVFESNVSGVREVVFESAPGFSMFHFRTDGSNVTGEIRQRVRLPGGYDLFRVYVTSTPMGDFTVLGDSLVAGDYVKAYLLRRSRRGNPEVIGFTEKTVAEGPVLDARVVGFEALSCRGISSVNVSGELLASMLNGSEASVDPVYDNATDRTVYVVSLTVPKDSGVEDVLGLLGQHNVSNVTVLWLGYSETADEMVVDGRAVAIPNNRMLQTTLDYNVSVNDSVKVRVYHIMFGNQSIAFATHVLGNGTGQR